MNLEMNNIMSSGGKMHLEIKYFDVTHFIGSNGEAIIHTECHQSNNMKDQSKNQLGLF
jgi:hypothetical protein